MAIVDLSEQGHQPMNSASGRYTITFNGELYNHPQLRETLPPQQWRGHSDTETFLAAIEHWGIEGALQRAVGMFALGLWDRDTATLVLARDRLGEKPLYYASTDHGIAFASELKALRQVEGVDLSVDTEALELYLQLGQVPVPYSIYRGVRKVPPGHWLVKHRATGIPEMRCYWQPPEMGAPSSALTDTEAIDRLETLLLQSIRGQLLSDVPLGAFLSGGVDSSLIAALMQRTSPQPVRTFSIGFAEAEFDESHQARSVAKHLGTDHTELHVSAQDALAIVPDLAAVYDEPFADASQVPTLLLAKLTRQYVTVALSGDGGDELFGGYNRHVAAARWWPRASRLPLVARRALARGQAAVPARWWDAAGTRLRRRVPGWAPSAIGEKVQKLSAMLCAETSADAYLSTLTQWKDAAQLVGHPILRPSLKPSSASTLAEQMMDWDLRGYLSDDILVKVDRAAMAHGLETRVPLLDHRVVEFALAAPLSHKIRNGQSKWLLRQVLYRHVPRTLIERPKQGFSLPLDQWLRGPLREWAESLLSPAALRETGGCLREAPITAAWREHLSGRRNNQQSLWNVLMLQAFLRQQAS